MSASHYVGRIGGLAVALGVGAAVFTGTGVACASPATADSSGGSAGGSTASSSGSDTAGPTASSSGASKDSAATKESADSKDSKGSKGFKSRSKGKDAATESASGTDTSGTDGDATDQGATKPKLTWSDLFGGHKSDPKDTDSDGAQTPEPTAGSDTDETDSKPGRHRAWGKPAASSTSGASVSSGSSVSDTAPAAGEVDKTPLKTWLKTLKVDVPKAASTAAPATTSSTSTTVSTAAAATASTATATVTSGTTTATASTPLANLAKRLLDVFAGGSGNSPVAEGPLSWIVAAASRREIGGGAQAAAATNPTMVLNGYNVVATGEPLNVGSFYGMFTNFPGFQGVVQGEQTFELQDKSGNAVGSFTGLVSQNNSIGFNKTYTQIVVTSVDSGTAGTAAGEVPAVGSTLASLGSGKYGTVYSSIPTGRFNADGSSINTVKYVNVTPFGTFRLFTPYDASKTLTDDVAFDRPIKTQDGFTIVPVDNSTVMTSVTGFPPFFQAVQGTQVYEVQDANGNVVGTFRGATTVTSDVLGTYTEAVYVNQVLTGTPGTAAGQTPPVGSVYNVIYFHSDDMFVIYSSKPSATGDVTSTKLVNPRGKVTDLPIQFDASAPPVRSSLDVPGDYSLRPVGDLQVIGVNGLPPREAILQGYQQMDVYDSSGAKLGTVNVDRTSQWDVSGNSTEAVLVTGIASVAAGADAADIPPVGSVFNFNYKGTTGFGEAYYALPGQDGAADKVVYKYVTPFGGIQLPYFYDAAKGLTDYDYYSPFPSIDPAAASPLAALSAGSALGSSNCFNLLACVA